MKRLSGGYCGSGDGSGLIGVKQEENGGKISLLLFHYLCRLCKM